MPCVKLIKTAKAVYIGASAVFCALGVLLLCVPVSAEGMNRALGAALVLAGGGKLLGYFSKDLYRLAFQYDLALGILLLALGVSLLVEQREAGRFLYTAMGVTVLAEGLFKAQTAFDAKRFGLAHWQMLLSLALVTGAAGIALTVWPEGAGRCVVLGGALVLWGALNLSVALCAIKIVPNQRPEDWT